VPQSLDDALADVRALLLDPDQLVRAVAAGRRRAAVPLWRKVELRPVDLKSGRRLQVTAYDERQAHTSNEAYDDTSDGPAGGGAAAAVDLLLAEPFGNWHVETRSQTVQLRVTKRGAAQVHVQAAGSVDQEPTRAHDRAKPALLDPAEPFWRAVGITDAAGRVKPSRQDKYRQVSELLRALDPVLESLPAREPGEPVRVVDLGCGNAYLSFAAYRFLAGARGLPVRLTGVDVKAQAAEHGARVAAELGWSDDVAFVQGSVLEALDGPAVGADVVLALHACDTATDEALARAVRWRAPLVLASPCCHHDVQRQLAAAPGGPPAPYAALTRHGILRERFADVLTDSLRAALLRLLGYRVEVIEFVGSQHTPRNTLIRAVYTGAPPTAEQVAEYRELTAAWSVTPHLETLLADLLADLQA
jgi:SAM-dependent methyltransferase